MATDGRPAQPKSILRGHKAQVHAAVFIRGNERLLTGDADGFVVAWDLTIMRPRAVWQAHENAILGIAGWGADRVITHGRDNKLIVWKLAANDETALSTKLPLDPVPDARPKPWILYMLDVNTMNFCSFSHCPALPGSSSASSEILVAVPNTLASEAIGIFHLPSQARQHTVKLGDKNGMVMALSLFHQAQQTLTLVAGYENGLATVAHLNTHGTWTVTYQAKPHSQPILSLDVDPARTFFLTSSADAILAKHPLPLPPALPSTTTMATTTTTTTTPTTVTTAVTMTTTPLKTINTKHAGQQSLHIRSDARLFSTAGWDARVRVYSARTLAEVAVLKWHTAGCYAVAFAEVGGEVGGGAVGEGEGEGEKEKQSGDAVAAQGGGGGGDALQGGVEQGKGEEGRETKELGEAAVVHVPKLVEMTVREKREKQARTGHWLAAGSKDGKVSLWDVF